MTAGITKEEIKALRNGVPCTRCDHYVEQHHTRLGALSKEPTDDRTRYPCVVDGCECANYERWARS